jgi:hypothetical protein
MVHHLSTKQTEIDRRYDDRISEQQNLTFGVGWPTIVALRITGDPFLTFSFSKGTITLGGCICCRSSFFGGGALTSNGPNCSGCADGPF